MTPDKPIRSKFIIIILMGIFLPFLGVALINLRFYDYILVSETFHSAIETVGAVAALIIAGFILILNRQHKVDAMHIWVSGAFFCMGVLDFFHAAVPAGQLFVWLHSTATLIGGALFVLVWLPNSVSSSPKSRVFLLTICLAAIVFGFWSIINVDQIPLMVVNGRFTQTAIGINVVGGVLFLMTAVRFSTQYKHKEEFWGNFLFAILSLLFGFAGILFAFSGLWDGEWWWWHLLRFFAYLISIAYLFIRYNQMTLQLHNEIQERELAEKMSDKKELRYRTVVESAGSIIIGLSPQFRIREWNRTAETYLGIDRENAMGKDFLELFVTDDWKEQLKEKLQLALQGESIKSFICQVQTAGKVRKSVLWNFSRLPDEDMVIAFGQDYTERELILQELEREKNFIEMLINVSPIIILVLDTQGRIVSYNTYLEKLCGYPLSEMQGKEFIPSFLPEIEQERIRELFSQTLNQDQIGAAVNSIRTKQGLEVPIEWHNNPIYDPEGGLLGTLSIGLDIRERQLAEKKIRDQNEFLNSVINSLSHPFYVIDADNYSVVLANRSALEIGNLHEKGSCYLVHGLDQPCDPSICSIQQLKKHKKSTVVERLHLSKNGEYKNVEIHAYPIFNSKGEVDKVIEYSLDVTDKKRMHENLKWAKDQAEAANRAKSEFLANMSHELRTPLNSVIGFSQVLVREYYGNLNEKQLEYLGFIRDSGDHLLKMVDDILDLSKIEAGKLSLEKKPFDFEKMLTRAPLMIQSQAAKKDLKLELNIEPGLGWLDGDEIRVKQVMYNLLSNAVKFTNPGKRIGIDATAKSDKIIMEVWDEGEGIADDDLKRIFHPFEQSKSSLKAKEKGTGLGLAISRRIVDLHRSELTVQSQVGEGSRFKVVWEGRLQAPSDFDSNNVSVAAESQNSNKIKPRILLVEDDKKNTHLIEAILNQKGYKINSVENGEEALDLFQNNEFELVLMDIQLPGMNGIQTMHEMKKSANTKVPFIAITSFAMSGDEEKLLAEGFNAYISKPIQLNHFYHVISQQLEAHQI